MGEFDWRSADMVDLIRRDRRRYLRINSPFPVAAAALALWLRSTWPPLAGVCLGMCIAWVFSLISGWWMTRSKWDAYIATQPGPLQLTVDHTGLAWESPHISRVVRWSGVRIGRVGKIWTVEVNGRELAFVPARVLSAEEAEEFQRRSRPA